jgi:hypothetical protein
VDAVHWNRGRGACVYVLFDPRSLAPRYVGKCTGYPNSRLRGHLREAASGARVTHKLSWLRSLRVAGREPILLVVERPPADELASAERRWIADLRRRGAALTNGTDGGEGMPNPSEETRRRLRARPRRAATAETRARISAALRLKWADPEWRAARASEPATRRSVLEGENLRQFKVDNAKRMGARNKGRAKTSEHRAKLAAAQRQRYADGYVHPLTGTTASDETKAKLRAAWERRRVTV